ncbi:Uncharacterized protein TCM_003741 [Theobroma cacao]|uniref:Uncharacterized protein n=1 Tax=Theobroma cacao TaxID=3641 RepID=A0A061DP94_THECC|nr:Uncharacterized protein TCM_003741 [Theobroma cacao]
MHKFSLSIMTQLRPIGNTNTCVIHYMHLPNAQPTPLTLTIQVLLQQQWLSSAHQCFDFNPFNQQFL